MRPSCLPDAALVGMPVAEPERLISSARSVIFAVKRIRRFWRSIIPRQLARLPGFRIGPSS